MKKIIFSINYKLISVLLVFSLIFSLNFSYFRTSGQVTDSTVLVDTDFSDWETNGEKLLAAGEKATISYEYDRVLGRKVIAAKLPKGFNGSNSIYVPKVLQKDKEYKVYIAYRVTDWSCISYNGSSVYDGGKRLDSQGWKSVTYTFTPTADNCYFRIGTNKDNYTIYIAELKLFETVSVSVGSTENGTGSVSASSAGVGEKVIFTASPNSGYVFSHWQDLGGNKLSKQATYEHTVTGETVLTPIFTENNDVLKYYFEDFEDGQLFAGGNTNSNTFFVAPSPDGSSKYSFKHSYTSGNMYYYIKTPSLSSGYTYTVSFKAYGAGENKWFRFNVHDSKGEYISKHPSTAPTDSWKEFSFDITPDADGWYVGFLMNAEVYLDDFKIINTAFKDEIDSDNNGSDDDSQIEDVEIQVGDVNSDGKINLKDIVRAKKDICAKKEYKAYSDVNYDNVLDALDLGLLSKFLLGKVDYFPKGGTKPYAVTLTMYDKDSYGITWNTNGLPGDSAVQISEGEVFNKSDFTEYSAVRSKESTYNKSDEKKIDYYVLKAVVSGLKEGKTYTYRVCDKKFGSYSEEFTFTVKNKNAASFKFIHVSDSQTAPSTFLDPVGDGSGSGWAYANALEGIEKNGDVDFVLHTGDIVEWPKYESYWRNMFDFNSKYFGSIPLMPVSGNHEATYRNGEYEIFKHFNISLTDQDKSKGIYYSFDYGNVKFIMIDTNDLSGNKIKSDQYSWLEETLKNNTQKWTIVAMHNPMYSVGQWGADSTRNAISLALRSQLSDLFAEYGVDIVLQGHDHTYSKTYPIGLNSVVNTQLQNENISGIDYCTNANGVIYIVNGAAGNQSRTVFDADEELYELSGNSSAYSWAELEVSEDLLSVKVYNYKISTKETVLWNSYGIKK